MSTGALLLTDNQGTARSEKGIAAFRPCGYSSASLTRHMAHPTSWWQSYIDLEKFCFLFFHQLPLSVVIIKVHFPTVAGSPDVL